MSGEDRFHQQLVSNQAIASASHDPERMVLGSMMLAAGTIDDVLETGLRSDHFYSPRAEVIFDAIVALHREGRPTDAVAVADGLRRAGSLDRAGGPAALHECTQAVATVANAAYYAGLVHETALRRMLYSAGLRMEQMAQADGEGDFVDILARAQSMLTDIATEIDGARMTETGAVDEALAMLESVPFVRTPWRELNAAIAGWTPSWHYVIGARPSVGKTAMAGSIILDAARRGWRPILFSMEMPRGEVMLRMLSDVASVDMSRLLHRTTRGEDDANLDTAAAALRSLPIVIDDRSRLSQAQMRARIRAEMRHGQPVLVVVDYLQLTKPPTREQDRRVQVDMIANDYKIMARDLKVPVISLAQLNRAPEGRAVPMPTMADLREAGGIEASADVILLMHRVTNPDMGDITDLRIHAAKNRHGETSVFPLEFVGKHARILDRPAYLPQGV